MTTSTYFIQTVPTIVSSVVSELGCSQAETCEPVVHSNIPAGARYWRNQSLDSISPTVASVERAFQLFTNIHLQIGSVELSAVDN